MFYTFYMWPSSMKLDLDIGRMERTIVGNNLPTSIKVLSTEIYLNFMRHRRRLLSHSERLRGIFQMVIFVNLGVSGGATYK